MPGDEEKPAAAVEAEKEEAEKKSEAGEGEDGEESELDVEAVGADDGGAQNAEFVERDFIPREYTSEWVDHTTEEVRQMIVRNKRPLIKMRISRKRNEFAGDFSLIDREGGENWIDVKPTRNMNYMLQKKILDIGLQAANRMISLSS
jgi:hypothetical protein